MSKPDFDKSAAALMAEFSRSGIAELNLRRGDFEMYLSNRSDGTSARRSAMPSSAPSRVDPPARGPDPGSAPAPATSPPSTPDLPAGGRIVTAPNLGTFYRAPKPGAAPYVEVGAEISEGEELCLIEVMKLFTAVRSDVTGRLYAVLAEDGSMVEAGQPLFIVVETA